MGRRDNSVWCGKHKKQRVALGRTRSRRPLACFHPPFSSKSLVLLHHALSSCCGPSCVSPLLGAHPFLSELLSLGCCPASGRKRLRARQVQAGPRGAIMFFCASREKILKEALSSRIV